MTDLGARALTLGYGDRRIVDGLTVDIAEGAVTAIVGPNACGKSTLLRGLARLLRPTAGHVVLDGADIATLKTKDVARKLGLLPQTSIAPEGITVADLVSRGRFPHQRVLRQYSRQDQQAVADAMAATGVTAISGRPVDELSGGQRQRVWVAMVLAQQTPLILLDEPTTYLDIAHQIELLDLFVELNATQGRTVVAVLHDLNHACRFADRIIAMKAGAIEKRADARGVN
ncbi:MAG: ABC transporter ATP-binding protein [Mycolicibacterium cosmeticum]|nr:ABC transporter ATP-binding protein [Mycolicibacterium cosmeticum]